MYVDSEEAFNVDQKGVYEIIFCLHKTFFLSYVVGLNLTMVVKKTIMCNTKRKTVHVGIYCKFMIFLCVN